MPFALVTIGLLMIVTGINNTYAQFGSRLSADLFGSNGNKGFVAWFVAIGAVGALGYVSDLRQFSHYFMALILISLVLSNKGVFANFQKALAAGPTTPQAVTSSGASPAALSAASSTAALTSAITANQSGAFGQPANSSGQAKFNGWINYLLGNSTSSGGQ